jgi:uncharacterized membrane protein
MELDVTLYTRDECELCDEARALLEKVRSEIPHRVTEININGSDALKARYGELVPVVNVGPYEFGAPIDEATLRMYMGAARDRFATMDDRQRKYHNARVERNKVFNRTDKVTLWVSRHYIFVVNIFLAVYLGLPFLAPVLMKAGLPGAARPIYTAYSVTCHQLGFRSWYLFGEQTAYPREAAGVDSLGTYGEMTGQNENDLIAARRFIGNEQLGYKVAYCQRDVAIYASMLLFGLIYAFAHKRIPALPWYLWILIGMGPIGIDGFSQLLSQVPNWTWWAYRESSPFLRTLTGGIFGFMTAWFGFPVLRETFEDSRLVLEKKLARLQAHGQEIS